MFEFSTCDPHFNSARADIILTAKAPKKLDRNSISAAVVDFSTSALETLGSGSPGEQNVTRSIGEQIASHLSQLLQDGALKPGQRILETELATQFKVSRGPVREALHLLQRDGIVRILPRRGAHIAQPSIQEVRDLYEIRSVLVGMAARKAALAEDRSLIPAIRRGVELLQLLTENSAAPSVEDYLLVRGLTGQLMLRMGGNAQLEEMVKRYSLQTAIHSLGLSPRRQMEAAQVWFEILNALEQGNPDAADTAGRNLVEGTLDEIISRLNEMPTLKIGKRPQKV